EPAVRAAAAASRRLGFGGQLCIHPRQVEPVNQGFMPTDDELAWARRVVQAVATGTHGAITVDGKLVDKPLHDTALAWLRQAGWAAVVVSPLVVHYTAGTDGESRHALLKRLARRIGT